MLGDDSYHLGTSALCELGKLFKGVLESPEGVGALYGRPDEQGLLWGGVGGDVDGAAYGDLLSAVHFKAPDRRPFRS